MSQGPNSIGSLDFTIRAVGGQEAAAQVEQVGNAASNAAPKVEQVTAAADKQSASVSGLGKEFKALRGQIIGAAGAIGSVVVLLDQMEKAYAALKDAGVVALSEEEKLLNGDSLLSMDAKDRIAATTKEINELSNALERNAQGVKGLFQEGGGWEGFLSQFVDKEAELQSRLDDAREQRAAAVKQEQARAKSESEARKRDAEELAASLAAGNEMLDRRTQYMRQIAVLDDQARIAIEQRTEAIVAEGEAITRANEAALKYADALKSALAAQNAANNSQFGMDRFATSLERVVEQLDQISNRMPRR